MKLSLIDLHLGIYKTCINTKVTLGNIMATMTVKDENGYLKEARKIFTNFLEKNKQRKTPERYAVLGEIYNRNDHFDAETLYIQMKNNHYNISRATVYNTLELLVACELVIKHQFGKNVTQYEKAYAYKQHDHLICLRCKKVVEFCDPRIQQIKNTISELFNFTISYHSLNMYGMCNDENCTTKNS